VLPVPGFKSPPGNLFHAQPVGQAAVMVGIVNERDFESEAQRQQVSRGIDPLVILKNQARTHGPAERCQFLLPGGRFQVLSMRRGAVRNFTGSFSNLQQRPRWIIGIN